MKRRAFVKLVAASMAVPLVPAQLVQAASFLESREFSPIVWHEDWWDYDNMFSIYGSFPDGRRMASTLAIRRKDLTEEHRDMMKRSLITWWKENFNEQTRRTQRPRRSRRMVPTPV